MKTSHTWFYNTQTVHFPGDKVYQVLVGESIGHPNGRPLKLLRDNFQKRIMRMKKC